MSLPLRLLGMNRTNLLAVGFGAFMATLATSAFGVLCSNTLGPFYADVPFDKGLAGDVNNNPGAESFTIEWGDGTASTGSSPGIQNNFRYPIYAHGAGGVHTYSAVMTGISITVVFAGHGSCTTNTFDVLAPPSPTPGDDVLEDPGFALSTAVAGVPVTGLVAQFTDTNPLSNASFFTASIDWGDGTQSDGVITRFGDLGPVWNVSTPPGGHTYATGGLFSVSISMTEVAPGTASSTATGTVAVATPPSPQNDDVLRNPTLQFHKADLGIPVTGVLATFSDSNPKVDASNFIALIQWGDDDSYGVVTASGRTLTVSAPPGGHTYVNNGVYKVFVTLTEAAPGTARSTAGGAVTVGTVTVGTGHHKGH